MVNRVTYYDNQGRVSYFAEPDITGSGKPVAAIMRMLTQRWDDAKHKDITQLVGHMATEQVYDILRCSEAIQATAEREISKRHRKGHK